MLRYCTVRGHSALGGIQETVLGKKETLTGKNVPDLIKAAFITGANPICLTIKTLDKLGI